MTLYVFIYSVIIYIYIYIYIYREVPCRDILVPNRSRASLDCSHISEQFLIQFSFGVGQGH
jgi:hypothetical protein